jgi:predicted O-methyltransferase YrrM
MKLVKEKIKSLGLGFAAGLAGTALTGIFALFADVSTNMAIPIFIGVAIVVGTAHYWKTLHIKNMQDEFNQVKNHLFLLGDSITETQGLVQLTGLNQPYPMPFGGSWALTPDAAAILAREIAIRRPKTIVELGSGVSTVMVGRLLQQMGCGHLISLDHDPDWARETRRNIQANGLQNYVEVLDAPLVKQQFDGKDFVWYQIPEQLRHIEQIDMLTVDGPPQTTDAAILARYPALPAFITQFSENAVIYIDDAKRDTEQKMIKEWQQLYPGWKPKMVDTIPGTCLFER